MDPKITFDTNNNIHTHRIEQPEEKTPPKRLKTSEEEKNNLTLETAQPIKFILLPRDVLTIILSFLSYPDRMIFGLSAKTIHTLVISSLTQSRSLDLSALENKQSSLAFKKSLLLKMTNIESLTLSEHEESNITSLFEQLSTGSYPRVNKLYLKNCIKLTIETLGLFLKKFGKSLTHLELSGISWIKSYDLYTIHQYCPNLKALYLPRTTIASSSFYGSYTHDCFTNTLLPSMSTQFTKLEEIDLSETLDVKKETLTQFIQHHSSLKKIILNRCAGLTQSDIDELKTQHPKIIWEYTLSTEEEA